MDNVIGPCNHSGVVVPCLPAVFSWPWCAGGAWATAWRAPSLWSPPQRIVLPRWPLACAWDKREKWWQKKNGSLPMGILRQALEIYSYFLELLGRNSRWVYLRISIPFQHPLVHHPVFCYGFYVYLFTINCYMPLTVQGLQLFRQDPLDPFHISFPQGCKMSYRYYGALSGCFTPPCACNFCSCTVDLTVRIKPTFCGTC